MGGLLFAGEETMSGERTFQSQYRDTRVRRPDFSLNDAIAWYLADYASEVEASTLRSYGYRLQAFSGWLPERQRTLASLEPETVERWLRTVANRHSRMNRTIALKSFARYLAERKVWYVGTNDARVSVLRGLRQAQPATRGTPAFKDEDVRTIIRAVPQTSTRLRTLAVIAVELHGFRSKEVRTMLLKNIVFPTKADPVGHFIVDCRKRTKSEAGIRLVPMEPAARDAVTRYVRMERPAFTGDGEERLFLTEQGAAFSGAGWDAMARRLREALKSEGVAFRQHRFRSTRAQLHAAGVPDSSIIELLGWGIESGQRMLHRYVGRIPLSTLKRYPPLLDGIYGRSA